MKRSLTRGEKWLYWLSGVILLGLGGLTWWRIAVDAEPDWTMPAPKPTPKPNGYDLYLAAAAAITPAKPPVAPLGDSWILEPLKPLGPKYSLARRQAWIKQNTGAWRLFEKAKAADSVYPSERGRPVANAQGNVLRELARHKAIVASTAKMQGDWVSAAQTGLDIIEMGRDIKCGAPMSGFTFGQIIESPGRWIFHDIPPHLDAKQARLVARRLEKLLATRPSQADALREEKWVRLSEVRQILQTKPWHRASSWSAAASPSDVVKNQFVSKRQIVSSYIHAMDWWIARAQQPYSPESQTEASNFIPPGFDLGYAYNDELARDNDARLSLLLLRLALRAYRMEKGSYPLRLEELIPSYLTQIPLDPFAQRQPFHYQKQGDDYILWSIYKIQPGHASTPPSRSIFGAIATTPSR